MGEPRPRRCRQTLILEHLEDRLDVGVVADQLEQLVHRVRVRDNPMAAHSHPPAGLAHGPHRPPGRVTPKHGHRRPRRTAAEKPPARLVRAAVAQQYGSGFGLDGRWLYLSPIARLGVGVVARPVLDDGVEHRRAGRRIRLRWVLIDGDNGDDLPVPDSTERPPAGAPG